MIDDVEQIGLASPLHPNPRFVSFSTDGGVTEYIVFINLKPLCKIAVFTRALMLWFVVHYVFHLEYSKEIKEVAYFFQEFVFGSLTKAKKLLHTSLLRQASSCMLSNFVNNYILA